jgi:hypothetical protein
MTDKQSERRKKLSDEIEIMRTKLLRLVRKHNSFIDERVIKQSRKLDEKIVKWQKKYKKNL